MMEKTALELLAEQVGTAGAETDGVLAELKKGAQDALADIKAIGGYVTDLLKAKKDADDKATADKAADKDQGDDDDDAAGYEDMELAVVDLTLEGATPGQPGEVAIDASKLVKGTVGQLRRMRKALKAQDDQIALLLAQNEMIMKALNTGFGAIANQGATLAKAVAESRIAGLDEAAPAITPTTQPRPRNAPPANAADKAYIGGSQEIEARALAKAQRTGVINFNHVQTFRQTRKFVADDAENVTVRAEVARIAETVR